MSKPPPDGPASAAAAAASTPDAPEPARCSAAACAAAGCALGSFATSNWIVPWRPPAGPPGANGVAAPGAPAALPEPEGSANGEAPAADGAADAGVPPENDSSMWFSCAAPLEKPAVEISHGPAT